MITHTYGYFQDAIPVVPVQLRRFLAALNTSKVIFFHSSLSNATKSG